MAVSETDRAYLAISELLAKLPIEQQSSPPNNLDGDDESSVSVVNNHININNFDPNIITTGTGNSCSSYYNSTSLDPSKLPGEDTPAKALLLNRISLINKKLDNNNDDDDKQKNNIININDTTNNNEDEINDYNDSDNNNNNNTNDNDNSDTLSQLYAKVKAQQAEIEAHRATVISLESDLMEARTLVSTFTDSIQPDQKRVVDTDLLDRELTKSQNANRAFQKALREIGEVVIAVAQGDLSKKVTVHAQEMDPEIVKFKDTINTMMDQLQRFASEVTRVATEVAGGTLGGQAEGDGTVGVWRELTDNVNVMASNLTNQVREIADVTRAVARGDLSRKINVHAQGEILELQKTINTMVDQLRTFAFEVTRVARETGVEGRLGGQAQIDDVEGIWKELTDNGKLRTEMYLYVYD